MRQSQNVWVCKVINFGNKNHKPKFIILLLYSFNTDWEISFMKCWALFTCVKSDPCSSAVKNYYFSPIFRVEEYLYFRYNVALLNIKLFSQKVLKSRVAYLKQYLKCSCIYECTFVAILNDGVLLIEIQILIRDIKKSYWINRLADTDALSVELQGTSQRLGSLGWGLKGDWHCLILLDGWLWMDVMGGWGKTWTKNQMGRKGVKDSERCLGK